MEEDVGEENEFEEYGGGEEVENFRDHTIKFLEEIF